DTRPKNLRLLNNMLTFIAKFESWIVLILVTIVNRSRLQHKIATAITFNYMSLVQSTPCEDISQYAMKLQDGSIKCTPCTRCKEEQCIASHCFGFKDSICRMPNKNEFILGHTCRICSDCGTKRIILRNCTQFSDTSCGGCIAGFLWDSLILDCVRQRPVIKAKDNRFETTVSVIDQSRPTVSAVIRNKMNQTTNVTATADSGMGKQYVVVPMVLLLCVIVMTLCGVLQLYRRTAYTSFAQANQTDGRMSNEALLDSV
ncbi:unnamed protein product, partial [Owenia fusiformis]